MVKVWIDILTPKQALLFGTIAKKLTDIGFKVYVTTRKYDYTMGVLDVLGVKYDVIGAYGGKTLFGKLKADIKRMSTLIELIKDFSPNYLLAYPNPSASRVAYGLGVSYIAFTDSPHSVHASRLSLPLASAVIFPKAIPINEIKAYTHPSTMLVPYDGVDEVLWLKEFKPKPEELRELGIEPYEYIIIRPAEIYASYYKYSIDFTYLVKQLSKYFKILLLPRYKEDFNKYKGVSNVILPEKAVYGPNVIYHSLLVISGGATMTREAALLGIPAINLYPEELYVDTYIKSKGLPLFKVKSLEKALNLALEISKDPKKYRVNSLNILKAMEDPFTKLLEVLKYYEENIDSNRRSRK